MEKSPVFSRTVEVEKGIFVTAHACRRGLRRVSAAFEKSAGADLNPREIPREVLKILDGCLAKASSCLQGENHSPYALKNNPADFVLPEASEFRVKVWREISKIPAGRTRTYSEIAAALGGEKYRRAVAGAVAANVFLLMVPCHRVIGKTGLGGFSGGGGIKMKKALLAMETGAAN